MKKLLVATDVFETNKFCYFYSKIVNFVFITITKNNQDENYSSKTTKSDILRFIFGFPFSIYIFYDVLSTKLQQEKRSILFEILLSLIGKIQTINTTLVIFHVFVCRYEYFKIFNNLYWIDYKVSFYRIILKK
jgi:hypothetical protein